jgi:hypothetical protein
MPRLRVDLCPACATFLRDLQGAIGKAGMCEVAGLTMAKCPKCSQQLPPELRDSLLAAEAKTALKEPS